MCRVALYIGADPFTFNDLEIVKKSIETFGFVNIFLDRKNRDAEYKQYLLNYSDRTDIIRHDLRYAQIENYKIIPVDETFEKAISENNIQTLLLNFDYQANVDFRMMKVMQYINPNLNIMLIRGQGYIEPKFIKTLLDSDSSLQTYKNFCSDYAFTKLKIKTMKKIGLTGLIGSNFEACFEPFKNHGYQIVDIESFIRNINRDKKSLNELNQKMLEKGIHISEISKEKVIEACKKSQTANDVFQKYIYAKVNCILGQKLKEMFADKVVVVLAMMCEFGMEGMMDKTIYVKCDKDIITKRLVKNGYSLDYISNLGSIQMDHDETIECCDYVLEDNDELVSETVKLINTKIKYI